MQVQRPVKKSLQDLAVMAEEAQRIKEALYSKDFCEKLYRQALERVVSDLDEVGLMLQVEYHVSH